MEVGKLKQIIANKNERLERDALNEAEKIIEQIAHHQQVIAETTKTISVLRGKLKELEVQQLDSQTLLGEGVEG